MSEMMFEIREKLRYTEDHEWILVEGNRATFGMDDYAQHEMGSLVYIDVPAVGTHIAKGEEIGAMESVKSVEPIYAPISGTIVKINTTLENSPETINNSPYDEGWIAIIEPDDISEIDELMDSQEYTKKLTA